MAGCFGNNWVDRHLESELMQHLDEEDMFCCEFCGHECSIEDVQIDDVSGIDMGKCPNCLQRQEI